MTTPFFRRTLRRAFMCFVCALLSTAAVQAQTPTTLSYQGRLLQNDASQAPAAGSIDVVFSLWSGPASDGTAAQLWSESWNDVALSNGVFSVLLGSNGSPLLPSLFAGDTSLFLQLQIDGETLLPREQLGSVPFAMVDDPANELQDLSRAGDTLVLSGSDDTVDLSDLLDNTDEQDLSLTGDTLSLTGDGSPVSLAPYRDNTDNQLLSRVGSQLRLTSDDGVDVVELSDFTNTDAQTLSLSGSTLTISGSNSSVGLGGFLDNTDQQDIANVLSRGTDAGDRDLLNIDHLSVDQLTVDNSLTCDGCVDNADIARDTIHGDNISDNIYILHIECNGSCADMSMREACDSIEVLRGLSTQVELIGVSCVHPVPSTTANGFVDCGIEGSDNLCRAFNLRTLGDIPCVNGDGTDAMVTCLETDIPL